MAGTRGGAGIPLAHEARSQPFASTVDLDQRDQRDHLRGRSRAQLDRFARDWLRRDALIRLDPIGMPEPDWAMTDHGGDTGWAATVPVSSARERYTAWDHRSGVATGPQRSSHGCCEPGSRR